MALPLPQHGLYAITPERITDIEELLKRVEQAIRGGAVMVQYRAKSSAQESHARALLVICRKLNVPLIVNDDAELASRIGADGVHLGAADMSLTGARQLLGTQAIIGVSCYNDYTRAQMAVSRGANYVAFGSFFSSPTKPNAARAPLELLRRARAELGAPVVAIGGITPENGGSLIAAGADLLAAIDGLFGSSDVLSAARRYAALFTTQTAGGNSVTN
ncbi:MAG: thiamine phosphate synthase [Gammaproteobacteria bacterium]